MIHGPLKDMVRFPMLAHMMLMLQPLSKLNHILMVNWQTMLNLPLDLSLNTELSMRELFNCTNHIQFNLTSSSMTKEPMPGLVNNMIRATRLLMELTVLLIILLNHIQRLNYTTLQLYSLNKEHTMKEPFNYTNHIQFNLTSLSMTKETTPGLASNMIRAMKSLMALMAQLIILLKLTQMLN